VEEVYVDANASQRASAAWEIEIKADVRFIPHEREEWLDESIPHFLIVNVGSRSMAIRMR
jgi:hypothetical protein